METKTISQYFENLKDYNFLEFPKLLLKLKNKLEKLGIKQVKCFKQIKSVDIFNELTLIIYPETYSAESSRFNGGYEHQNSFYTKIKELRYSNGNTLYFNKYFSNEGIPIKIKIDNEEKDIGIYIKNKNLLVLFHRIFYFCDWKNTNKEEDNSIIYFFINALEEFIKTNKVKTEDLTNVIKNRAIELFKEELNNEILESVKRINIIETDIKSYDKSIQNLYFEKEKKKRSSEVLKEVIKNLEKNIVKQIKEIKTLPFVKSVRLLIKGLKIDVGSIKIKDVYIGDFVIYITPREINIENTNPQDNEKRLIHPHIDTGGNICFGNRRNLVYEMLAKYEYKKLVYFLYLFLKSYNKNDKYYSITYWNGKSEEEEEEERFCEECNSYVNDEDYNDEESMCYSCWNSREEN